MKIERLEFGEVAKVVRRKSMSDVETFIFHDASFRFDVSAFDLRWIIQNPLQCGMVKKVYHLPHNDACYIVTEFSQGVRS